MDKTSISSKLQNLRCCVLIPTYNNYKTLKRVLNGVLEYTDAVIVVNDGSTDSTLSILENYSQIEKIHLKHNKGKGNALKVGIKHAINLGYDFAITLDSDGQHFPSDIPVFIEHLESVPNKDILIIGDRNMNEADVFAQSAKGNRVSTYWVKAVTGLDLSDSQSGFRLYPIKAMKELRFFKWTRKFEFEVEAIVKSHWKGIEIGHVPIKVLYDQSERVSHFRPFMDIARIVVLIIWFLLVKLFYIIPRNFFRRLKKKGFKKFIVEDFLANQDSPKKKALSIALGVFLGLSPLWGFHTVIVIFLAILLKLNKVIAFVFSNISLPPFIPFVLMLSLKVGDWVTGQETSYSISDLKQNFDAIKHLKTYLIGSITLSVSSAIIFGLLGYIVFNIFNSKSKMLHA